MHWRNQLLGFIIDLAKIIGFPKIPYRSSLYLRIRSVKPGSPADIIHRGTDVNTVIVAGKVRAALILPRDLPQRLANGAVVDGDLETIVLKCLEKEPQDRYGSAGELADLIASRIPGFTCEFKPDYRQEIADTVRDESIEAIVRLKSLGVRQTVLISGDSQAVAEAVGHALDVLDHPGDWPVASSRRTSRAVPPGSSWPVAPANWWC